MSCGFGGLFSDEVWIWGSVFRLGVALRSTSDEVRVGAFSS